MKRAIPKKSTSDGSEGKLPSIKGFEIRPASTPKNAKKGVIGFFIIQELKRGFIIGDFAREAVYEVGSSEKSLVPEFQRYGCFSEKS